MTSSPLKMELLAPAGGFEQLRAAVDFGADAVYLAGERFGMRARAANFAMKDLPQAVAEAHRFGVKVHMTCNIMMMPDDTAALPAFLEQVDSLGVDALIIGDMGAFALAERYAPHCQRHVSTQASVSNGEAAKAWHALGATRIVCAREMTLADIAQMRSEIPDDLELEAFVHGAQCMAVSGRCLISSYLTGRSGNRGHCTQPCRWNYTVEEEKRPGVHFPIEEDGGSTFLMNALDLNMVSHLRELAEAGVSSIKIEGRNKKAFYVATVVGAYRRGLDGEDPAELERELRSISHRPYGTGFYFGDPEQALDYDGYEQETLHVADVVACEAVEGEEGNGHPYRLTLRCRNRFAEGERLEVLSPREAPWEIAVEGLCWGGGLQTDAEREASEDAGSFAPIDVANRSCDLYQIASDMPVQPRSFLRRREFRRSARHRASMAPE